MLSTKPKGKELCPDGKAPRNFFKKVLVESVGLMSKESQMALAWVMQD